MKTGLQKYVGWLLALGFLTLPFACATLPVPTEETASTASQEWPGTSLADLQTGRRLYVQNCASCHHLHLPSEFSVNQWGKIMERMQIKAKIDDEKTGLVLRYILVNAPQGNLN